MGAGRSRVLVLLVLVTAWQAWIIRAPHSWTLARSCAPWSTASMPGIAMGATDAARRADDAAARADWHSHTPVWWLAQHLPVVGDDVEAVRVVSDAAHDLTEGVVSPLAEAGLTPDQFRPQEGRIPIEPVRRAAAVLDDAAPRVTDAEGLRGPPDDVGARRTPARARRGAAVDARGRRTGDPGGRDRR